MEDSGYVFAWMLHDVERRGEGVLWRCTGGGRGSGEERGAACGAVGDDAGMERVGQRVKLAGLDGEVGGEGDGFACGGAGEQLRVERCVGDAVEIGCAGTDIGGRGHEGRQRPCRRYRGDFVEDDGAGGLKLAARSEDGHQDKRCVVGARGEAGIASRGDDVDGVRSRDARVVAGDGEGAVSGAGGWLAEDGGCRRAVARAADSVELNLRRLNGLLATHIRVRTR